MISVTIKAEGPQGGGKTRLLNSIARMIEAEYEDLDLVSETVVTIIDDNDALARFTLTPGRHTMSSEYGIPF